MRKEKESSTMLQRSRNLLSFTININRYDTAQLCIGLTRKHANALIMPKYGTQYKVYKLFYSQRILANKKVDKYEDCRWTCMKRFSSDTSKKNQLEKKVAEESQKQKITVLDEEKLGKLKERVLDIEPISSIDEKKDEKGETIKLVVKQLAESNEPTKDDTASKKGNTPSSCTNLHFNLFNIDF